MSHLVNRTPFLDVVMIPSDNIGVEEDDSMEIIQAIRRHHPHRLPILVLTGTMAITQRAIRELIGFRLKEFSAQLFPDYNYEDVTTAEEAHIIKSSVEWLGSQSKKMRRLLVRIWKTRHNITFQIPPLAALRELEFRSENGIGDNECPIRPLISNQFPVLRNLTLHDFRDSYGIFQQSSFSSVRELRVGSQLTLLTAPWHTILPNLTTLQFMVSSNRDNSENDGNNLTFLLRHFPCITELKLVLANEREHDFWDILTGGAPRPSSNHDLLYGEIGGGYGELQEPVHGVYQTSSLRNLRCLKRLLCWPGTRSNLNAILYVTRTRLLVPLENITLYGENNSGLIIQHEDAPAYEAQLSQIHGTVDFRFGKQTFGSQWDFWRNA